MKDAITMQTPMQPYIKLVQGNMALLTQFSMSPEVVSQAMSNAQSMFQREAGATGNLAQSTAFAQLVQGMLKNYTEFIAELGQSGMSLLAQGQAAMLRSAEDASESATSGSDARARRSR
ncbi:hypothetical protein [Piscinibacter sp. XHJ-5]|uniref:hypothetical protein n=1 Tax=Piscinibacter sp. XHJ-5 TaxID=3037797 RepID=UPI002452E926|nr:hypothetical protein [Piscinibacter sp. XHJ-5]